MDDGQSRTFKVNFESEGVDDYGIYVCVFTFICVYKYICIYVYMILREKELMIMVYMCAYLHIQMYMYMYTCKVNFESEGVDDCGMYVCIFTCIYFFKYICMCIYIYV
jgi:hypothetical protein